jgi:hypothetical protein
MLLIEKNSPLLLPELLRSDSEAALVDGNKLIAHELSAMD